MVIGPSSTASDELQEEEVRTHQPTASEEEAQIEDSRESGSRKWERWWIKLRVAICDAGLASISAYQTSEDSQSHESYKRALRSTHR